MQKYKENSFLNNFYVSLEEDNIELDKNLHQFARIKQKQKQ